MNRVRLDLRWLFCSFCSFIFLSLTLVFAFFSHSLFSSLLSYISFFLPCEGGISASITPKPLMATNSIDLGTSSPVRFTSWNIKGLGSPVKRTRVSAHLKCLKADLVFLQETHMHNKDQVRLKFPWVAEVFHSNFNSKSRGVAILVRKSVQFSSSKVISDPNPKPI